MFFFLLLNQRFRKVFYYMYTSRSEKKTIHFEDWTSPHIWIHIKWMWTMWFKLIRGITYLTIKKKTIVNNIAMITAITKVSILMPLSFGSATGPSLSWFSSFGSSSFPANFRECTQWQEVSRALASFVPGMAGCNLTQSDTRNSYFHLSQK